MTGSGSAHTTTFLGSALWTANGSFQFAIVDAGNGNAQPLLVIYDTSVTYGAWQNYGPAVYLDGVTQHDFIFQYLIVQSGSRYIEGIGWVYLPAEFHVWWTVDGYTTNGYDVTIPSDGFGVDFSANMYAAGGTGIIGSVLFNAGSLNYNPSPGNPDVYLAGWRSGWDNSWGGSGVLFYIAQPIVDVDIISCSPGC